MKILSIHDIAGFGRSSLTTIISVLSSLGHQCVPAVTAVFSTHTAIKGFVHKDLSDILDEYIEHYSELNLEFSAIYSGFLSSASQIDSVIKSCKLFKNALVIVDPVMGDDDKVYKTYTPEMCEKMKDLIKYADIITPNITEAKILLDMDIDTKIDSEQKVLDVIQSLLAFGDKKIIITGLHLKSDIVTTAYFDGNVTKFYENPYIPVYFPGTGDLFASILIGSILNGASLDEAVKKSSNFVCKSIEYTSKLGKNNLYGVEFEPLLPSLR